MFKTLKEFFEIHLLKTDEDDNHSNILTLELAATVLMVEISLADSDFDTSERKTIEDAMRNVFHIPEEEIKEILNLAEREVGHAISLHDYTRLVNEKLSAEEKVKVVELLWRVAFADAVVDKYEEYYIRKIADLLYVTHSDYIKAKHNAS